MSNHPSDDGRLDDEELSRLSAELEAAELRDAEREFREQEKELADAGVEAARPTVSTAG